MKTTVKSWFADKKYGFLKNGEGTAPDIIVHVSELKNCNFLKPGRTVEFECHINDKGLFAKNVSLVYETAAIHGHGNSYATTSSRVVRVTGWNQVGKIGKRR